MATPNRFPLAVVAGMPRGGTTFLYHNLGRHPRIFLPTRKELNYFNVQHGLGPDWYREQFAGIGSGQVGLDISPPCFLEPRAPRWIRTHDPDAKVILVVRDPIEWALSYYVQFSTFNFAMPSFAEFLEGYDYRMKEGSLRVRFRGGAIVETIDAYREAFGADLLLYDFDFFRQNRLAVLQAIERFLDLPPVFASDNFDDLRINASARRNVRLVSWLLSREGVIRTIQRWAPDRLTKAARHVFDRFSASGRGEFVHPDEHVDLAESLLADQRPPLRDLFATGPMQLGDGRRFDARDDASAVAVSPDHEAAGVPG